MGRRSTFAVVGLQTMVGVLSHPLPPLQLALPQPRCPAWHPSTAAMPCPACRRPLARHMHPLTASFSPMTQTGRRWRRPAKVLQPCILLRAATLQYRALHVSEPSWVLPHQLPGPFTTQPHQWVLALFPAVSPTTAAAQWRSQLAAARAAARRRARQRQARTAVCCFRCPSSCVACHPLANCSRSAQRTGSHPCWLMQLSISECRYVWGCSSIQALHVTVA